jgi:prepilin-type N-terminal cleavage/methylation domain-containing protein
MKKNSHKKQNKRGFTLFEVLVSVAIFTILTTSILVKNGQFKNSTLTSNLAAELGLVVRKAQSYGIGVRGSNSQTSVANASKYYGIYLKYADDSSVIMFRDGNSNSDGVYQVGSDDVQDVFRLNGDYQIDGYSVKDLATGNVIAGGPVGGSLASEVSVSFRRPDPSAKIFYVRNGISIEASEVTIRVRMRKSGSKVASLTIYSTGQIYVQE